jgi:hypothetical protein
MASYHGKIIFLNFRDCRYPLIDLCIIYFLKCCLDVLDGWILSGDLQIKLDGLDCFNDDHQKDMS